MVQCCQSDVIGLYDLVEVDEVFEVFWCIVVQFDVVQQVVVVFVSYEFLVCMDYWIVDVLFGVGGDLVYCCY